MQTITQKNIVYFDKDENMVCGRCRDLAVVTLLTKTFGIEGLCKPCSIAVIEDDQQQRESIFAEEWTTEEILARAG